MKTSNHHHRFFQRQHCTAKPADKLYYPLWQGIELGVFSLAYYYLLYLIKTKPAPKIPTQAQYQSYREGARLIS